MDPYKLHHVGIAVHDMPAAIDEYVRLFNYVLSSGPYDDPLQQVSVCFLHHPADGTVLELVAPLGDSSTIKRHLKQGGPYHLCYEVPDLRAAMQFLEQQGAFLVSGPTPAVAFGMRPIAWFVTSTRLLVELLQQ